MNFDDQKNIKPTNKLQSRLLLRIGVLALTTGLLFSGIQIYIDFRHEKKLLSEQIEQILSTSRKSAALAVWNLDPQGGKELLSGLMEYKIIAAAELRDDLGDIIASAQKNSKRDTHNSGRALFGGDTTVQEDLFAGNSTLKKKNFPRKIGVLQFTVDPSLIAHDFVMRTVQVLIGDLFRVGLLVVLLLAIFNLTLTLPLLQVGRRLREINPLSPGADIIEIPTSHENNELGIMIRDLNALLSSVQHNIHHREVAEQDLLDLNRNLEQSVTDRTSELASALGDLQQAHQQLKISQSTILQQDKMASIGQLAAGVAHEINNPMGFITSNLGTLNRYRIKLFDYLEQLEKHLHIHGDETVQEELRTLKKKLKIDILSEDIEDLLDESKDGAERVKEIVQNLKGFSRLDQAEEVDADINDCLEKTLNIAWNEIKYKAEVEKDYADLPLLRCFPQQLNQVFLNLVVNAAHAIEEKGLIKVSTKAVAGRILISISDNGCGIPEENISRLFEPFFTTKDVGKGTGLGLSIAYDIVQKHGGELTIDSIVGEGTTFTVSLPMKNGEPG